MRNHRILGALGVLTAAAMISACGSTPNMGTASERDALHSEVQSAITQFQSRDPSMKGLFDRAEAYAVFPNVKEGAVVLGGAHGRGEVFQRGHMIGYADISQGSVGAQLGGQKYSEVIFFQNEGALSKFQQGQFEFDARASAIAASEGAARTADYSKGVIVFSLPESGLMAQAAVGGQKFRYEGATASDR